MHAIGRPGFLLAALLSLFVAVLRPLPGLAEDAGIRGAAAAYAAEGDRLFAFLEKARTEDEARAMEDEIWHHWMLAPDAASADLMKQAMERRRDYDLAGAVGILDKLVALAPDWAEGWNQRATIRFMQDDFEGSLADIQETLAREPRHFGALAGMALILIEQGRAEQAQAVLKQAVGIDPFLRERVLIQPIPGKDI